MLYELHCTCNLNGSEIDPMLFREHCFSIGVKPVQVLLNENNKHTMTSSTKNFNTDEEMFEYSLEIKHKLQDMGYVVERVKIESEPTHHMVPTVGPCSNGQYLESHVKFRIPNNSYLNVKKFIVGKGHLSYNAYKHYDPKSKIYMITFRREDLSISEFYKFINNEIQSIKRTFGTFGIEEIPKTIVEFALYDSNIHLDDEWINS